MLQRSGEHDAKRAGLRGNARDDLPEPGITYNRYLKSELTWAQRGQAILKTADGDPRHTAAMYSNAPSQMPPIPVLSCRLAATLNTSASPI